MSQVSSQNRQVRIFFGDLQEIPGFFANSPQRLAALETVVHRKIPRVIPTRWNFKSRTVNTIFEYRNEILECMEEVRDGNVQHIFNKNTANQAGGIVRILEDKNFMFWLTFFHYIMPHVDILYNQLQQRQINPTQVKKAVHNFEENITQIRQHRIDKIVEEADSFDVMEMRPTKRARTENKQDSRLAAIEVCDVIINAAKDRFEFTGHLVAATLFLTERFSDYCKKFPDDVLTSTVDAYPMLEKQRLRTELSVIYMTEQYRDFSGIVSFLNFLIKNDLSDTFWETIKLSNILITIPMTTSEAERCFSSLKRIKTFLRNTMSQDRLTALAVLSIESKFIRNIPSFNEKVVDKFADKKDRRIELHYKK